LEDNTTRIWDALTGKQIGDPMRYEDEVQQFSPDGRRVLTVSKNYIAQIWDAVTGKQIGKPMKHELWLKGLFSLDGQRILTVSADNTARLWDA
jgi:WD40 repeat protein